MVDVPCHLGFSGHIIPTKTTNAAVSLEVIISLFSPHISRLPKQLSDILLEV